MAHNIVRLAQQFLLAEAADFDEARIDIGDPALGIGLRDDGLACLQQIFDAGNRQVVAHDGLQVAYRQFFSCEV